MSCNNVIITLGFLLSSEAFRTVRKLRKSLLKGSSIFRRVRKIAKNDYYLCRVRLSVRPHGTTRLSLEGF
jgi:hypothetical protein